MTASFATLRVLFLVWFLPTTFSLSFFFFKAESISNVSCNEKDKQALLTLKRGLTDHGHVLSSWSDHKDCCIWDGVFCDKKIGRVTELHLNNSRLGGEISGSLLRLEHLNYLDLSGNDFNCTPIPTFLGSMYSLTLLDLTSANFSGLIPHELGNLSSLRHLSLWNNSDLYVDNLRWMSGFSTIQHLDLSDVDLHREVDWPQIMSCQNSCNPRQLQFEVDINNLFLYTRALIGSCCVGMLLAYKYMDMWEKKWINIFRSTRMSSKLDLCPPV